MARSKRKSRQPLQSADGHELRRRLPQGFVPSSVGPGVMLALCFNAWTHFGLLCLICGSALYAFMREALFGPGAVLVLLPAPLLLCVGIGVAVNRARWLRRTRPAEGIVVDIHTVESGFGDSALMSGGSGKPSHRYIFRLGALGEEPWSGNYYARFTRLRGVSIGDAIEVAYDMCFPRRILPLRSIPGRPSFSDGGQLHVSRPDLLLAYVAVWLCIVGGSIALLML